jgi:hypothetical protein
LCGKSFEPEAGKGTGRAQKGRRGGKLTVRRGGLAVISEEVPILTQLPKWVEVKVVPRGIVHHNSARASAPDFKVFHVEQGKTWRTFAVKKPSSGLNHIWHRECLLACRTVPGRERHNWNKLCGTPSNPTAEGRLSPCFAKRSFIYSWLRLPLLSRRHLQRSP